MGRRFSTGAGRHLLTGMLAATFLGVPACQRNAETFGPSGSHVINMEVLKGRGGETLALVPVYIEGRGPFAFALDTGASRSVVDYRIAAELHLPTAGGRVEVTGVGGQAAARPVQVTSWRVADIQLPAAAIDAMELSGRTLGLQGLLGSDMLSKFEVIHIDYKRQRLVFHPGPSGKVAGSH